MRGWIGTKSQMLHYLETVGADKDEEGRFLVRGDIVTFMGQDVGPATEVVVGHDAEFSMSGEFYNLAAGMGSTSYGSCPIVYI